MSREFPQMKLRMSPELKDKIEDAAKEGGRSMNAEIVHRLEQSFEKVDSDKEELAVRLREIDTQKQVLQSERTSAHAQLTEMHRMMERMSEQLRDIECRYGSITHVEALLKAQMDDGAEKDSD